MSVTIDQLIAKLQQAKDFAGGETAVCFWNDHNGYFTVEPSTLAVDIKKQVAPATNSTPPYVSLELNKHEY